MKSYGKELILDLYGCDATKFTRCEITGWLNALCLLIDMQQEDLHFWDYDGYPEEKEKAPVHLAGTSGVQFITTSSIVIHTLNLVEECYINIFSCKEFNTDEAAEFAKEWFRAKFYESQTILRGRKTKCQ